MYQGSAAHLWAPEGATSSRESVARFLAVFGSSSQQNDKNDETKAALQKKDDQGDQQQGQHITRSAAESRSNRDLGPRQTCMIVGGRSFFAADQALFRAFCSAKVVTPSPEPRYFVRGNIFQCTVALSQKNGCRGSHFVEASPRMQESARRATRRAEPEPEARWALLTSRCMWLFDFWSKTRFCVCLPCRSILRVS